MSQPEPVPIDHQNVLRSAGLRRLSVLAAGLLVLVAAIVLWFKLWHDPDVIWLSPSGGAQWIRADQPFQLVAHHRTGTVTVFQKRFELSEPAGESALVVHALKLSVIDLDGQSLYKPNSLDDSGDWKRPIQIAIPPLPVGSHELRITVGNPNGPSALLAYANSLDLATGSGWVAGPPSGESELAPTVPVTTLHRPQISDLFLSRHQIPAVYYWALGAIFVVVFVIGLARPFARISIPNSKLTPAGSLRWVLIAAWAVLAVHNFTSLSLDYGFDRTGHVAYVEYLSQHHRVPLATEGWQMFQSPLYYVVAALVHAGGTMIFDDATAWRIVLLFSVVAVGIQVQFIFWALKAVFPTRQSVQCLGLLVAGLMPMGLYMSQLVGNEPLAGLFGAGAVTLTIVGHQDPQRMIRQGHQVAIGLLLGLAVLTKVSAVLLFPPISMAIILAARRAVNSGSRIAFSLLRFFATVVVVSGWYYLRNWYLLGKPFIGGWDAARGIDWWQDPGYRTLGQFTSFGEALCHPVYAVYAGFWDSLYSTMWLDGSLSGKVSIDNLPPWNHEFMLAGAWLALLPTVAILVGVVAAFLPSRRTGQSAVIFSVSCVATYVVAMLYLFLHVPIYSTAKASYTLALLPCYGVLAAAGFEIMVRNRILKAAAFAWMTCWATAAWCAYLMT
jgi:hypothetical protein